ncbi:MAG TPA: hypothetical protein VMZ28_15470 [Kofleriaceae bacterium]|nr:hypothetical protein [Kofleriaceae bacterium]
MKANSSGNRHSRTGYSFQRAAGERVEREEDRASPAQDARAYERELFAYHQQDLARRALHLGSPGAARAALRALYGDDFADSRAAMGHLRTLRDPMATPDEVTHALRALVQLEPAGSSRNRITTEIAFMPRDAVPWEDE